MKIWMTSLVISERQTETSMSYHFTHIKMIRVKKSDNNFCGGCEEIKIFIYCWWESETVQKLWKTSSSLKIKPTC